MKTKVGLSIVAAREQEFRLALLVLFLSATDGPTETCAKLMDEAAAAASTADARLSNACGAPDVIAARFGAARLLNGLCGACQRCQRGWGDDQETVMAAPPRHAPGRR